MASTLDRLKNVIFNTMDEVSEASTIDDVEIALDKVTSSQDVSKEFDKPVGKMKVHSTAHNISAYYTHMLGRAVKVADKTLDDLPVDDPYVDFVLAEFWKSEPLLSGAVYSMASKMSTLSWTFSGRRDTVMHYADVLTSAVSLGGRGWGDFLSPTAQDFYSTNRGAFWYTPRIGSHLVGKLAELSTIDSLCCALTGNPRKPVFYSSSTVSQDLYLRPGEYAHFKSLSSPREYNVGAGLCAVFRAYKSARILLGLSQYDWEKLNNLPPEGVAPVSGMSQDEFQDALALWRAARERNKSLTFPQVLWLLGSTPNSQITVDFVGFSQMPESFNRRDVVDQYVNTLALVFGVDAREFWPISSGSLGTASETEVQHMKAKGKGPGEFMAAIERWVNGELPQERAEFTFDTQDVGEDQIAASIAKGWVDAFMPLYNPGSGTTPSKTPMAPGVTAPEGGASQQNTPEEGGGGAEPLITKDDFLRLLVDRRVLPNWVVDDEKVTRTDLGITEKEFYELDPNDDVIVQYKDGKLHYIRPTYTMKSDVIVGVDMADPLSKDETVAALVNPGDNGITSVPDVSRVPDALLKEGNIKGKPISGKEALRGPRTTKNTVKQELELWLDTPELAAYVPTPDEHEYTQALNSVEGD